MRNAHNCPFKLRASPHYILYAGYLWAWCNNIVELLMLDILGSTHLNYFN